MENNSRKTKRELIEIIKRLENEAGETVSSRPEKETNDLENALMELRREYDGLKERYIKAEEQKTQLREENADLDKEINELKEKYTVIEMGKKDLISQYMVMEKNLKEVYDRLRTCEEHYEIFKSFVEEDEHPTGLIDRSYTIRYANGAALQSLGISDASEILDQKLFDFFSFEDALKLKEKIDKVFVEGGTEKIKKMTFQNPGGNPSKLKMKLIRVRYRNHPSIKMVIE